jgi:hypothetical protein
MWPKYKPFLSKPTERKFSSNNSLNKVARGASPSKNFKLVKYLLYYKFIVFHNCAYILYLENNIFKQRTGESFLTNTIYNWSVLEYNKYAGRKKERKILMRNFNQPLSLFPQKNSCITPGTFFKKWILQF